MASNITFRSAASANSNTVAITTPAKGDLIVVACWDNAAATVPTVPAGYLSVASTTTTALGGVCAYRVSDGTETSVPAFTNGTNIVVGIYRGAFKVGANGTPTTVNSATLTYPTLTPQIADGSSWVVGMGLDKGWTAGANGTTAALTSNRTNQTTCNLLDTNGGVASFAQQSLTGTGSGRGIGFSVELRQAPAPAETLTLTDDNKSQIRGGSVDFNFTDADGKTTLSSGTLGSEALSLADALSSQLVVVLTKTLSDQMTITDKQLVFGIEFDVTIICPEWAYIWADDFDFVDTQSAAYALLSDKTPWNELNENFLTIPFETFDFVLGPSIISVTDRMMTLVDVFAYNLTMGGLLTETLSDTMTLSDSLSIGYGEGILTETLTITDSSSLGYGLLIADTLTLTDTEVTVLGINELFSDTLTMSDSTVLEYGQGTVDSLTFSDSNAIGYGDLISDTLTLTDSVALLFALSATFSETLTISDSNALGYGFLISDTLTLTDSVVDALGIAEILSDSETNNWSDSLAVGYGQGNVDSLTFSDSSSVGYGDLIFDSLTLTDSEQNVLGINELLSDTLTLNDFFVGLMSIAGTFSDQIVMSDTNALGYGDQIAESLTLTDFVALLFALSMTISETLTISDATALGYGFLISDSLTLTDSETTVLGIVELFSDTLTLSDSLAAGYGNAVSDTLTLSDSEIIGYGQGTVDSLTFSDANAVGYGDLITDSMTESDSLSFTLGGALISEFLNDTLTMSDALGIGYGEGNVDALTFSDSSSVGYGDLISDNFTLTDSEVNVLSFEKPFAETLTFSDSTILGYGQGTVDSLTFSDSSSLGYGDQITDTLTLSDSASLLFTMSMLVSETLTIIDSDQLGYGFLIADSETANWLDNLVKLLAGALVLSDTLTLSDAEIIGYGNQYVEQLIIIDTPSVGYGDLIADNLNNWLDNFQFTSGQPSINLTLNDAMTFSEQCGAGYGNSCTEQITMSEQAAFMETMLIQIADATPAQLDALAVLFTFGLQISEIGVFQDQLATMWGIIVGGESISLADRLDISLQFVIALALSDTEVANWLDAILTSMVFSPGEIVMASMSVLSRVVADLQITNRTEASEITTVPEAS